MTENSPKKHLNDSGLIELIELSDLPIEIQNARVIYDIEFDRIDTKNHKYWLSKAKIADLEEMLNEKRAD